MSDVTPYLEIRTASPSGYSPDGSRRLISSNLTGTSQVYRLDDGVAELRQLTDLEEPAGAGYLPHADRLLVVTDAGGNERHQLYAMDDAPPAPVTSPDQLDRLVVDPDHIHRPGGVSRDGRLLAYATNRRNGVDFDVVVRDLRSGDEEVVWDRGGWNGAAGFSPDGHYVAVTRLTDIAGDNQLHLVDRADGTSVEIAPHDGDATVGGPSWLPDGHAFFFATSVGREFTGIARYEVATGTWEHVLGGEWNHGCAVDWQGRHLLVTANEDGYSRAWLHDPATLERRMQVPLPGDGVASGYRFSRDGRLLAFGFSSATVPGDAFELDTDTGTLTRLTTSPCALDTGGFVAPELVRFTSFDGESIPAFVFRPSGPAPDDGGRPVVVVIHGGPESQWRPSFGPLTQYLVAQGFAVVAPNVRGSTGYGRRYQHLDDVERRLDSVRDLAALHDWLATQPDLDQDRAALYGGSYGGYMVLAGLAFQPRRWAAGVDIVGISSLVTFLENTSVWRRAFREREYGSLENDRELLVEASPITHVDRMRAPLFIIHGANDPRVPLGEAEQLHDVLAAKGIRCELLVYDDEGHGLAKLANRIDAYPRVAAFLHDVLDAPAVD